MAAQLENPYHGVPLLLSHRVGTHLETADQELVLTFDDGPHPDASGPILDILARYEARATFFLIGHNVRRYPDIVRRMQAEGHALGNHTETHPKLPEIDTARIRTELEACQEAIKAVSGVAPTLFRPSYGRYDDRVLAECSRIGLRVVQWSAMVWDWLGPSPEDAMASFSAQLAPGAILLLHDGSNIRRDSRAATIALLGPLLERARDRGFRVVPLADRLARLR